MHVITSFALIVSRYIRSSNSRVYADMYSVCCMLIPFSFSALYLQLPAGIIFTTLLVYTGLVLYARYHDADPLQNCLINKRDQVFGSASRAMIDDLNWRKKISLSLKFFSLFLDIIFVLGKDTVILAVFLIINCVF